MTKFQISVKAIIYWNDRYLLRKNERNEWELLGGRIENIGENLEYRLHTELLEESGISIEIIKPREPWFYNIGNTRTVIIAPYYCSAINVPDILEDEDGGVVAWHTADEIRTLNMPYGYFDSIQGVPPRNSFSAIPETRENEMLLKPKVVKPWRPYPEFEPRIIVNSEKRVDRNIWATISTTENVRQSAFTIAKKITTAELIDVTFMSFSIDSSNFLVEYLACYDM